MWHLAAVCPHRHMLRIFGLLEESTSISVEHLLERLHHLERFLHWGSENMVFEEWGIFRLTDTSLFVSTFMAGSNISQLNLARDLPNYQIYWCHLWYCFILRLSKDSKWHITLGHCCLRQIFPNHHIQAPSPLIFSIPIESTYTHVHRSSLTEVITRPDLSRSADLT